MLVSIKKRKKSKFEKGNLRVKKPRKLMILLMQKVCNTNLKGFIIVSSKRQLSVKLSVKVLKTKEMDILTILCRLQ